MNFSFFRLNYPIRYPGNDAKFTDFNFGHFFRLTVRFMLLAQESRVRVIYVVYP